MPGLAIHTRILGTGLASSEPYSWVEAWTPVSTLIARCRCRVAPGFLSPTGSTAIMDENQEFHYFLTGNVNLLREIGRTWSLSLNYARAVTYVDTVQQPVVSDSVVLSFGGLINRRLQFASAVGTSIGRVGLTGQANGFDNYYANASMTMGLTRNAGVGLNYGYFRFGYDNEIELDFGRRSRGRSTTNQCVRQRLGADLSAQR